MLGLPEVAGNLVGSGLRWPALSSCLLEVQPACSATLALEVSSEFLRALKAVSNKIVKGLGLGEHFISSLTFLLTSREA